MDCLQKENFKDMDAMMNVLKEYGLEIDWFELKQIGFRQRGLI